LKELIIVGAGGLGRETALMVQQINGSVPQWKLIGFCDDGIEKGKVVDGIPVLGGTDYLNERENETAVAIAIADPITRKRLRNQLTNPHLYFPKLIHPKALVGEAPITTIGEGVIIAAGTVLTTNVHVKPFAIINLNCTIGHDAVIGEYCSVMPSANISGNVVLGEGVFVGAGVTLLPAVSVGDYAIIGAGAVVLEPVEARATVVGIPAKKINR
jgi:sugar O-acyltransferase (sialic acid O-acetyltransferase NeuD family)